MKFNKYHCLENDFIITESNVDNIKDLCDQHKYIGADGLIYINNNKMYFFNKDGSKANMCGNGIRCAAKYLNDFKNENTIFNFENNDFKITHINNLYTLYYNFLDYKKIKDYYFVFSEVNHIVLFKPYNKKIALKLFKKYNTNITFYFNNKIQTYEKGVGETKGCGTGLIAVMNVLYFEKNITAIKITSLGGSSNLKIEDNKILLESEVYHIYKGELVC